MTTTSLPPGYRLRRMGEIVRADDLVQIWTSFYPVAGSAWEGDVIDNEAKARCIWTAEVAS